MLPRPAIFTLTATRVPYTTLFRSLAPWLPRAAGMTNGTLEGRPGADPVQRLGSDCPRMIEPSPDGRRNPVIVCLDRATIAPEIPVQRSEEHTSELQPLLRP